MAVAQLVEGSLPTTEIRGLNPVVGDFHFLSTVLKHENKDIEALKARQF